MTDRIASWGNFLTKFFLHTEMTSRSLQTPLPPSSSSTQPPAPRGCRTLFPSSSSQIAQLAGNRYSRIRLKRFVQQESNKWKRDDPWNLAPPSTMNSELDSLNVTDLFTVRVISRSWNLLKSPLLHFPCYIYTWISPFITNTGYIRHLLTYWSNHISKKSRNTLYRESFLLIFFYSTVGYLYDKKLLQ